MRASLQREGPILTKMWTSRLWANTDFKMRVWATLRLIASAGLNNSVSHFKRESEQLHVSLEVWVWATPRVFLNACLRTSRFDFNTDFECCVYTITRGLHPARDHISIITDPITGLINSSHNGRVNLHYGGISGDNYTPITPINSLKDYERGEEDFWDFEPRISS